MIIRLLFLAGLFLPMPAFAQSKQTCDAACGVPCYFGSCAPALKKYRDALAKCSVTDLDFLAGLYRGTDAADKAVSAASILRERGYGTKRIGVTPNAAGGGGTMQDCTALVEGGQGGAVVAASASTFDAAAEMWRRCDAGEERYCRALVEGTSPYAALARIELQKFSQPAPVLSVPAIAALPADPCRDYQGVRPVNANCLVENGKAVWISKGLSREEIARQQAEAERLRQERTRLAAQQTAVDSAQVEAASALARERVSAALRNPAALGSRPNDTATAKLYDACMSGSANACHTLAHRYQVGTGVAKDLAREAAFAKKACDGGDLTGCGHLADQFKDGGGVLPDLTASFNLYERACNGGHARSCSRLGRMYQQGLGVAKDKNRARELLRKGCDGGDKTGCNILTTLQ